MGYREDVIERPIGATSRVTKFAPVYNHAQYMPERRKMMQDWADYIDSFVPVPM
jgi:hypothetical protein